MSPNAALLAVAILAAPSAPAQVITSFGAAASSIRYEGFPTGEVIALTPRLEWRQLGISLLISSTLGMHEDGDFSGQGRARLYAVSDLVLGPIRFGLEAGLDGTTRSESRWTASVDAVAEGVYLVGDGGFSAGMGLVSGGFEGTGGVSAGLTRIRGWQSWGRVEILGSFQQLLLPDTTYGDFAVRGAVVLGDFEALGALLYRVQNAGGSRAATQGALRWYVTSISALEIGVGSYLADPIQGLPSGRYLTAGVRVFDRAPRTPPVAPLGSGVYESRESGVEVTFEIPRAQVVEIVGDWNGWIPIPMERRDESNTWVAVLRLAPGIYHFNLRVDKTRWIVPRGVEPFDDGFGGKQGVLIVM